MVALNFQSADCPMHINNAKFTMNCGTGYLLKPVAMKDPNVELDPHSSDGIANVTRVDFYAKVI